MGKAYKMFRVNKKYPGKLFPLFVDTETSTPIGVWVEAKEGERKDNGKVKSKLGDLAFRPGWHLSDYPLATHIGVKDKNGIIKYIHHDFVWCACEYADEIDYQPQANERGINKKGIIIPKNAFLDYVPINGCYRYKTSPMMFGEWIISGNLKINQILDDDMVADILIQNQLSVMERDGGPIDLKKYGF